MPDNTEGHVVDDLSEVPVPSSRDHAHPLVLTGLMSSRALFVARFTLLVVTVKKMRRGKPGVNVQFPW